MGLLRGFFGRRRAEQVLDDEVRHHIDQLAGEYQRDGMTAAEARRAAELRFGRVSSVKESVREQNGIARVETFWQDLRFASRVFRSQPGFTVVLLLTLALGIGANTAVYSVLQAVLLKPLPLAQPERIVYVWEQDRVNHSTREGASYPDYVDLKRDVKHFQHLAAAMNLTATLTGQGEPERVQGRRVSSDYFSVLGVRPILGRAFGPHEPGIILSYALWQRKFGGAADILGRTIRLDGVPDTILGVMPDAINSIYTQDAGLWTALEATPNRSGRGQHNVTLVGRLLAGSTVTEARTEVAGIMARLEKDYPEDNKGRGATVVPLHEDLAGNLRPALRVLTGAVALLLVIACINIANLLMARASSRTREMAIRASLGAGRARLTRQLLTESALLALMGAALGIALAYFGIRGLLALAPPGMALIGRTAIDWNTLAAAVGFASFAWLIFGVFPAVRSSGVFTAAALKQSSKATASKETLRLRNSLVVAQLAMTCVLVVSSGLLIRSFYRIQHVDLGYEPQGAVSLRFQLPETRYSTPKFPAFAWPEGQAFLTRLKGAVSAIPGVEAASIAMAGPNRSTWTTRVSVIGRPLRPEQELEESQVRSGDPDYPRASGAKIVRGRFFDKTDTVRSPSVVVVNEAFVRRYFRTENPIGQSISVFVPRQIVGVIGDIHYDGPTDTLTPTVYLATSQFALPESTLIVRSRTGGASTIQALRSVFRDLDPNIAPFDAAPLESTLAVNTARERFTLSLLTAFAILALNLAIVGIYGVVAYSVGGRRKEIALRMVLGARPAEVFRQIASGMVLRAAGGILLGIIGAYVIGSRLLQPLVFETSTNDPATYVTVSAALILAAFCGAAIPASRAARVNAASTLREE